MSITPKTQSWILSDTLSKSHSQQLKAALYSYFNVQRPLTNIVPNGYHLIYFNPKHDEESLSKDGYDSHQQPLDETFKRRLWVGGELNFIKPLEFNKQSFCVENINRMRKLGDDQLVSIDRELIVDGEVHLEEKRHLLYTPKLYTAEALTQGSDRKADFAHILKPTDLLLFRYSGLSFNSHKIHYDRQYSLTEGYPNILVQGPLTVTLLLEWVSTLFNNITVTNFKYKNHSPIFANDSIKLGLSKERENKWCVWIEGEDRKLHVSGTLVVE
jgi:hydroxyacyl-ACP dehydratase HTD2-like protein with hotdog domain